MKKLTVGVPIYHAQATIEKLLSSIQIQSISGDILIIFAPDSPEDAVSQTYRTLFSRFPNLDITILPCDKNTGPGLARQRALEACKTDWIIFMDADDILISPFALENLYNNITPNCIEVQGPFYQEIKEGYLSAAERMQLIQNNQTVPPRMLSRNDVAHPWIFGRLYNVKFLRA